MIKIELFDLTFEAYQQCGDDTCWYHVYSKKDITIEDLVSYILEDKEEEWGEVRLLNEDGSGWLDSDNLLIEYRYGSIVKEYKKYSEYKDKHIGFMDSNGGWSNMDYYIIPK